MIHHSLTKINGEYVWERIFVFIPKRITTTKMFEGNTEEFETFVWLETIERRFNHLWIHSETVPFYEYRLLKGQQP